MATDKHNPSSKVISHEKPQATTSKPVEARPVTVNASVGVEKDVIHYKVVGITGYGKGYAEKADSNAGTTLGMLRKFNARVVLGFQSIEEVERAMQGTEKQSLSAQEVSAVIEDSKNRWQRVRSKQTESGIQKQDNTRANTSSSSRDNER